MGKSVRVGHWGYPLPFTNLQRFTEEPILLTPIRKVIFEHLDMEVLYDPNAKTTIVYHVYCRAMERKPCSVANGSFFRVTRNLEDFSRTAHPSWTNSSCEACSRCSVQKSVLCSCLWVFFINSQAKFIRESFWISCWVLITVPYISSNWYCILFGGRAKI